MTVTSEVSRIEYAGNGVTVAFTTPQFLANAHIVAYLVNDTTGAVTNLALTTNYTLTGAGAASGTLTALVAPASGYTLVISTDVPATQETDYVENDPFPAASHETALDKLTLLVRQLQTKQERSIKFADSAVIGSTSLALPAPVASYAFVWNDTGDAIEFIDPGSVALAVPADASVTLAKHANFTAYTVLGRASGTGAPSLLSFTAAGQAVAGADDAAAQRTALGLGAVAVESLLPVSKGGTGLTVAMSHVSAKYDTTGQTVASGAAHTVTFNTEVYDTLGEFSSDTFTAANAGYYHIVANATFASDSNWDAGNYASLGILVNGISDYRGTGLTYIETTGVGISVSVAVSRTVLLAANDTVKIILNQNSGSTQTLANSGTGVFLNIDRLH